HRTDWAGEPDATQFKQKNSLLVEPLPNNQCESGVEREDQHRSGEPTEHTCDQALVGTYL
ncbi:hypothetical protein, partial [Salinibacter ruber]|uniref:hypothetical protein n=1 Tax=Salinibacter ruber TaxID=146919 RepID=UPI002073FABC